MQYKKRDSKFNSLISPSIDHRLKLIIGLTFLFSHHMFSRFQQFFQLPLNHRTISELTYNFFLRFTFLRVSNCDLSVWLRVQIVSFQLFNATFINVELSF